RHFPLQAQQIDGVPIVRLRPDLALVANVNQVRRHAHAIALAARAAADQIVDTELAADFVGALLGPLVSHGRLPSDDPETFRIEPAEMDDHLLGDTVAQILLLWVAAAVLDRQYRQHRPLTLWSALELETPAAPPRIELGAIRVYGAELLVDVTVNRQPFT